MTKLLQATLCTAAANFCLAQGGLLLVQQEAQGQLQCKQVLPGHWIPHSQAMAQKLIYN
jgi:putative hemolysin